MPSEYLKNSETKTVCVVVLGDFGRSPRMQYHSLSLSKNDFRVHVVAYKGTEPLEQISEDENIHLHHMKDVPKLIGNLPRLLQYVLKTLWQAIFLFWTLMTIPKLDCILLQNPPSIPTLPICWLICCLRDSCLFVDFHNYGYTIMSLTSSERSPLVRIAKWCEMHFGSKADKSICVTKAMKDDLSKNWNVRASVFYDCAPDIFHPITIKEKHSFFLKMCEDYKHFKTRGPQSDGEEFTRFTKKVGKACEMMSDRPALVVSCTSWTEDEDFSILLNALEDYDAAAKSNPKLPDLLVAITGKGPLKSYYEALIEEKNFSKVEIITMWLKFEDYPTFLACADLGVSLHNSSSGFDLPMKVVDMFGCCLPVAAVSFHCIDELVKDGVNGTIFSNSEDLAEQFQQLFDNFPKKKTNLDRFRRNLEEISALRWEENWCHTVKPLLRELFAKRRLLRELK